MNKNEENNNINQNVQNTFQSNDLSNNTNSYQNKNDDILLNASKKGLNFKLLAVIFALLLILIIAIILLVNNRKKVDNDLNNNTTNSNYSYDKHDIYYTSFNKKVIDFYNDWFLTKDSLVIYNYADKDKQVREYKLDKKPKKFLYCSSQYGVILIENKDNTWTIIETSDLKYIKKLNDYYEYKDYGTKKKLAIQGFEPLSKDTFISVTPTMFSGGYNFIFMDSKHGLYNVFKSLDDKKADEKKEILYSGLTADKVTGIAKYNNFRHNISPAVTTNENEIYLADTPTEQGFITFTKIREASNVRDIYECDSAVSDYNIIYTKLNDNDNIYKIKMGNTVGDGYQEIQYKLPKGYSIDNIDKIIYPISSDNFYITFNDKSIYKHVSYNDNTIVMDDKLSELSKEGKIEKIIYSVGSYYYLSNDGIIYKIY